MASRKPLGHVVHIERLDGHGVKVWLDGQRVKSLRSWSLTEEHRPPSVLTFAINTDEIFWGPPPAAVAEGSLLELSREAAGYLRMLEAVRRVAYLLNDRTDTERILSIVNSKPPVAADERTHYVSTFPGGRVTPSGKRACETCGEPWVCSAEQRRLDSHRGLDNPSDPPLG